MGSPRPMGQGGNGLVTEVHGTWGSGLDRGGTWGPGGGGGGGVAL